MAILNVRIEPHNTGVGILYYAVSNILTMVYLSYYKSWSGGYFIKKVGFAYLSQVCS